MKTGRLYLIILPFLVTCCCMVPQSDYVQYRCGLQAEPVNLDPAKTDDFAMVFIGNNLYETLVTLSDSGLTPQPLLATDWTIAENGTRYDFMLRDQVFFHDGAPFNAEAVKISFERQIFPTSKYYSETPANIYAEEMLSMIESIDVIDSLQVSFKLKYAYAAFLNILSSCYCAGIVSPNALRLYGADLGKHPVGTGAFRLQKWDKGRELVLVPNEHYWQAASKVQISYTFYSRESQRLLDFQNGKLDILPSISHTNRERFLFDKNSEVRLTPAMSTFFLGFNSKSVRVNTQHRRAIRHALDREKLVYTGSRGGALPAYSILPPGFGFAREDTAAYRPEYARKLLEKSNFDFSQKLLLVRYQHTPREIIDLKGIASYLAKIGVQVEYQLISDWMEYNDLISTGIADIFLDGGTSTYAAPDEFLTSFFYSTGPVNLFHYSNPDVDSMLEQAQNLALEPDKQKEMYQKVLNRVAQDVPCIPISHSSYVHVIRGQLKGLEISPLGFMNFQQLSSAE